MRQSDHQRTVILIYMRLYMRRIYSASKSLSPPIAQYCGQDKTAVRDSKNQCA